jgi:hypothetical protein
MDCPNLKVPDCLLMAEDEPRKKHKRHPIHKTLGGGKNKTPITSSHPPALSKVPGFIP